MPLTAKKPLKPLFLLSLAAFLLVGTGCGGRTIVVHDEPRLVSEKERLVVAIEMVDPDGIRLQAFRRSDRVFEQTYWKEPATAADPRDLALPSAGQCSSIGVGPMPDDGLGAIAAIAIVAFYTLVVVVAWPFLLIGAISGGSVNLLAFVADDERTTVRRIESSRTACVTASVESPETRERLNLGPQPEHGWILLPETLRLLGGPGATVIVRDGSLEATVTLGSR